MPVGEESYLEPRVKSLEEWRTRVHPDLYGEGFTQGIIRELHDFLAVQLDRKQQSDKRDEDRIQAQNAHNSRLLVLTTIFGVLIAFVALAAPWIHSAFAK
jgi:hypothetical protein